MTKGDEEVNEDFDMMVDGHKLRFEQIAPYRWQVNLPPGFLHNARPPVTEKEYEELLRASCVHRCDLWNCPKTIEEWLRKVDGDPSRDNEALSLLKQRLERQCQARLAEPGTLNPKDARVAAQVTRRTKKRRMLSKQERMKIQAITAGTAQDNTRDERAIIREVKRRQQDKILSDVKPKEGEDYEVFMDRCRKSGYDESACEVMWNEAKPELEGEERREIASFDKIGEDEKSVSPEDAKIAALIMRRQGK